MKNYANWCMELRATISVPDVVNLDLKWEANNRHRHRVKRQSGWAAVKRRERTNWIYAVDGITNTIFRLWNGKFVCLFAWVNNCLYVKCLVLYILLLLRYWFVLTSNSNAIANQNIHNRIKNIHTKRTNVQQLKSFMLNKQQQQISK